MPIKIPSAHFPINIPTKAEINADNIISTKIGRMYFRDKRKLKHTVRIEDRHPKINPMKTF